VLEHFHENVEEEERAWIYYRLTSDTT